MFIRYYIPCEMESAIQSDLWTLMQDSNRRLNKLYQYSGCHIETLWNYPPEVPCEVSCPNNFYEVIFLIQTQQHTRKHINPNFTLDVVIRLGQTFIGPRGR